jgi:hypothetical protein
VRLSISASQGRRLFLGQLPHVGNVGRDPRVLSRVEIKVMLTGHATSRIAISAMSCTMSAPTSNIMIPLPDPTTVMPTSKPATRPMTFIPPKDFG